MASMVGEVSQKIPEKSDTQKPVGDVTFFRDPERRTSSEDLLNA